MLHEVKEGVAYDRRHEADVGGYARFASRNDGWLSKPYEVSYTFCVPVVPNDYTL